EIVENCITFGKNNKTNIKKYLYYCQEIYFEKLSTIMEEQSKSNKVKRVRPETLEFIILYNQLRGRAFKGNTELAETLGFNSPASITEIIKSRQNIDPDKLQIFKEKYKEFLSIAKPAVNNQSVIQSFEGIPMY